MAGSGTGKCLGWLYPVLLLLYYVNVLYFTNFKPMAITCPKFKVAKVGNQEVSGRPLIANPFTHVVLYH